MYLFQCHLSMAKNATPDLYERLISAKQRHLIGFHLLRVASTVDLSTGGQSLGRRKRSKHLVHKGKREGLRVNTFCDCSQTHGFVQSTRIAFCE